MGSKTKDLGTLGEQALILEFLKNDIPVLQPIGDNLPYDFVVEINNHFYKIQAKATEKIKEDGVMEFHTNITNPYTHECKRYTSNDIDYFGLYCKENNFLGLIHVDELTGKTLKIRIDPPKNNQKIGIKMIEDFTFSKKFNDYFN